MQDFRRNYKFMSFSDHLFTVRETTDGVYSNARREISNFKFHAPSYCLNE